MSRYEEKILGLLKKGKIAFKREVSFRDLKKGKYRFDFEAFFKNERVLIEINGSQHYKIVKKFHKTRNDFLAQQERDRRKIRYCLSHNIKLYIIPFWEIPRIQRANEIFQEKFLARDMWKNDKDWLAYQNLTKG